MSYGDRKPGVSLECGRCHRIGTRAFVPTGSETWECSNDRACKARAARRSTAPEEYLVTFKEVFLVTEAVTASTPGEAVKRVKAGQGERIGIEVDDTRAPYAYTAVSPSHPNPPGQSPEQLGARFHSILEGKKP